MSHPHFTRWPVAEAYCDPQSIVPGQPIRVRAASRTPRFELVVTHVASDRTEYWRGEVECADHGVRGGVWATGCDWPVAVELPTDGSWPSGFYELELTALGPLPGPDADDERRRVSHAYVVVRPTRDTGTADRPLLVLATNTWQAYNQWGGRCMYSGASKVSAARPLERGYLRRPIDDDGYDGRVANLERPADREHRRLQRYLADHQLPLWNASSGWHTHEHRLVAWAARHDIDLDVAISNDLHDPDVALGLLDGRRLLISAGHDEYWSWQMRDHVDAFVEDGGNWLVLSGNTCFWQVRAEGDVMTCHKGGARPRDPIFATGSADLLTSMWSDPMIRRPETSTTGLTFTRGGYHRVGDGVPDGAGGFTVHQPEHWAFEGTDLRWGDQFGTVPVIVGYEVDGCAMEWRDGRPHATGADGASPDTKILATCPARLLSITEDVCEPPEALWASVDPPGDLEGVAMILHGSEWADHVDELGRGHAVMAEVPKGDGTIVNVGTTDWVHGLDDPVVDRITKNLFDRLS